MLTQMNFYWWEEKGKVCVQNMVAGLEGQYHEHTLGDFKTWKDKTEKQFGKECMKRIN